MMSSCESHEGVWAGGGGGEEKKTPNPQLGKSELGGGGTGEKW